MADYRATMNLETLNGDSLAIEATVGRHALRFDSGREATAATPVENVLAAVGACAQMDVIGILRKMRQKVTAYTVEVNGERRDEHPRIFTHIEIVHRVRGHDIRPSSVERAIQLSCSKYCSVHAMLCGVVRIESRYEIEPEIAEKSA